MHVVVDVPEWSSLGNATRSLINFFMQDAKLYFSEVSSTETSSNIRFTGNIRWPYRAYLLYDDGAELDYSATAYFLDIPYASSVGNSAEIAKNIHPIVDTKLVQKNSSIMLASHGTINCGGSMSGGNTVYFGSSLCSVTLNPMLGDTPIGADDPQDPKPDYRPTSMVYGEINIPVKTTGYDFETRFQLKTTPFKVKFTNNGVNTEYELYYKVGYTQNAAEFFTNVSSLAVGTPYDYGAAVCKFVFCTDRTDYSSVTAQNNDVTIDYLPQAESFCQENFLSKSQATVIDVNDLPIRIMFPIITKSNYSGTALTSSDMAMVFMELHYASNDALFDQPLNFVYNDWKFCYNVNNDSYWLSNADPYADVDVILSLESNE